MNSVPVTGGALTPGAPAVAMRPEELTVGADGLPGTVLNSTFLGPVTRLVVGTEVGELTVDVVSRAGLPGTGEPTAVAPVRP